MDMSCFQNLRQVKSFFLNLKMISEKMYVNDCNFIEYAANKVLSHHFQRIFVPPCIHQTRKDPQVNLQGFWVFSIQFHKLLG